MKTRQAVETSPIASRPATGAGTAGRSKGARIAAAGAIVILAATGPEGMAAINEGGPPAASKEARSAAALDVSRYAERAAPAAHALQPIILAQQSGFYVADILGPPGRPLPLEIRLPPEDGDLFRVIMVRGLPQDFELTAGVSLDDAWAISPSEVGRVELVAPPGYSGQFSMEVLFIRGNGEARQKQIANVRIDPQAGSGVAQSQAQEPEAAPKTAASAEQAKTPTISPALKKSMFARAESMMSGGDIAGARLILRYLADNGMAGAAYAMGQSFDPGFLQDIYVRGEDPSDIDKARDWYRRAAEMGNGEAASRLTAMQQDQ